MSEFFVTSHWVSNDGCLAAVREAAAEWHAITRETEEISDSTGFCGNRSVYNGTWSSPESCAAFLAREDVAEIMGRLMANAVVHKCDFFGSAELAENETMKALLEQWKGTYYVREEQLTG